MNVVLLATKQISIRLFSVYPASKRVWTLERSTIPFDVIKVQTKSSNVSIFSFKVGRAVLMFAIVALDNPANCPRNAYAVMQ